MLPNSPKEKGKKSEYAGTALPSIVDDQSGYYISCYRNFIALPRKHRLDEKEKVTTKLESMSRRSLNENSIYHHQQGFSSLSVYLEPIQKIIRWKDSRFDKCSIQVKRKQYQKLCAMEEW